MPLVTLSQELMSKYTFSEVEDIFELADNRATPEQWQQANRDLMRQMSMDAAEQGLWRVLLQQPSTYETNPLGYENNSNFSFTQESVESLSREDSHTSPPSTEPARVRQTRNVDSNYEKNICAYITKKVVQCLLSRNYRSKVQKICERHNCSYETMMEYYGARYKEVFGITHLTLLVTPESEEESGMKEAFLVYLRWFLREKYMLYLLKYGKMSDKDKYIEFKNKYLLFISKCTQNQPISTSIRN